LDSPRAQRRDISERRAGPGILFRLNVEWRREVGTDGVVDAAEVQPVKKIECLHSQLQVPALGIERNFSRKPQIDTPEIGTDARISSCKYRPIGRGVTVSVDIRPSKQIERPRAVAFKNR